MYPVPKKQFGQHFLHDATYAHRIVDALQGMGTSYQSLLEVGPGPGVLTHLLYPKYKNDLWLVEIDKDLHEGLRRDFPLPDGRLIGDDFLKVDLNALFTAPFGIIGNFPYNISTQIVFSAVHARENMMEMVGMFQREVGARLASPPGNKDYGILSVWAQAFYHVEYLFTVPEGAFVPPPKVKSGVVHFTRRDDYKTGIDEVKLLSVVKASFSQRRKTMRNALRALGTDKLDSLPQHLLDLRAEALHYTDYIEIVKILYPLKGV